MEKVFYLLASGRYANGGIALGVFTIEIKARDEYVKQAELAAGESPFVARMRERGLLP